MTFCNRLKRYGIDIQKDHFLLFQEMRNKAKKILCGKIEEMIELKRNKNLVFKYGDEEEFNINQIKDSDNLESPFNGQMFGSLMQLKDDGVNELLDFNFKGIKTFDLEKQVEFKQVEEFQEDDDERDYYLQSRKEPEMLYEDELQLMKRYKQCVSHPSLPTLNKKEAYFTNYNTLQFSLNPFGVYYLRIFFQRQRTILNFRIKFQKDHVIVSVYDSVKGHFFLLKLRQTEIRQVEYLKNIINIYGRFNEGELQDFFTHNKVKSQYLRFNALLLFFQHVKQMNGRNVKFHQEDQGTTKAILSIKPDAIKFHILKNSKSLMNDPNFECSPIFLRAKVKNFGDSIVSIFFYKYIGYSKTNVKVFINIAIQPRVSKTKQIRLIMNQEDLRRWFNIPKWLFDKKDQFVDFLRECVLSKIQFRRSTLYSSLVIPYNMIKDI